MHTIALRPSPLILQLKTVYLFLQLTKTNKQASVNIAELGIAASSFFSLDKVNKWVSVRFNSYTYIYCSNLSTLIHLLLKPLNSYIYSSNLSTLILLKHLSSCLTTLTFSSTLVHYFLLNFTVQCVLLQPSLHISPLSVDTAALFSESHDDWSS